MPYWPFSITCMSTVTGKSHTQESSSWTSVARSTPSYHITWLRNSWPCRLTQRWSNGCSAFLRAEHNGCGWAKPSPAHEQQTPGHRNDVSCPLHCSPSTQLTAEVTRTPICWSSSPTTHRWLVWWSRTRQPTEVASSCWLSGVTATSWHSTSPRRRN